VAYYKTMKPVAKKCISSLFLYCTSKPLEFLASTCNENC